MFYVPFQYYRTNSLHNTDKMCPPCHPTGLKNGQPNVVYQKRKPSKAIQSMHIITTLKLRSQAILCIIYIVSVCNLSVF